MGIAAIEEWEAEKRQRRDQSPAGADLYQRKHSAVTPSQTRDESARRIYPLEPSAIAQRKQDTLRSRRQRHSKKRIIPGSSSSAEVPESQQEVLSDHDEVVVEVNRPIDFCSQDYSTVTGSQVASVIATQETGPSKNITEGDSTLGSSLPTDSPVQAAADRSMIRGSTSQVLSSYPEASTTSPYHSAAGGTDQNSLRSGLNHNCVGELSQPEPIGLLVVRSDPVEEADTVRSNNITKSTERKYSNSSLSPLFVPDEGGFDRRPRGDPNRSKEEIETEGELEFLPTVSSPISSGNLIAVQLTITHDNTKTAVSSVGAEQLQSEVHHSRLPILHASYSGPRHQQASPLSTTPIESLSGSPTASACTTAIQGTRPASYSPFHSKSSLPDATSAHTEPLRATSQVKRDHKRAVTTSRRSQAVRPLPSSESVREPAVAARERTRPASPLLHPTPPPHQSVQSSPSDLLSKETQMANSHRETSPHVRKPPSAPYKMSPESGLREKLRQIRATSRANQSSRSRNQANTGDSKSAATTALETRSSCRPSPPKKVQSPAIISTGAEDQPVPSLENVDGSTCEVEFDKPAIEPALSSSMAPPQPVCDPASGTSNVPIQVPETEKTVPQLDISARPLLHPYEFVVPLPIDGRIRHQYIVELAQRYKDINDFLGSPRSPRLINAMTEILRKLDDTVVHTDLGLNGPATQPGSTAEEALWAEDASSKFAFLAQLINILGGSNHQIVVVARSGTTLDLLHSYFKGKGVNCRLASEAGPVEDLQGAEQGDLMRYTLLPTTRNSLTNIPPSASLIIAFDSSFDAAMLPDWCTSSPVIPVLLLLVVNSAEHVARCVPQDLPQSERLRRLVKALVHVHGGLGKMAPLVDYRHASNLDQGAQQTLVKKDLGAKIAHAAGRTAEALRSNNFAFNFTLRPITELHLAGLEDHPPLTAESKEVSPAASRAGTPCGQKRLLVSRWGGRVESAY